MRPVTRLRLLLPSSKSDPRSVATVELLANRVADALSLLGVQVRQQVHGAASDGAPRADVALWLPDVDGGTPVPDARSAPARAHVAFVVDPALNPRNLSRYDALLVAREELREPLRASVQRSGGREIPIVVARLAGDPLVARDAEKALRTVSGQRTVLVDVRGLDEDLERVVVQLALMGQDAAAVLLVSHDERVRARVRSLCTRHAVNAWLTSGPEAFTSSIGAADLVVGALSWDELFVAALHRVPVAFLSLPGGRALLDVLHAPSAARGGMRIVDEVAGPLQLAAGLDRRLSDPGALEARGIALRDALFGPERELVDALASVEPSPHGAPAAAAWEPVGPHALEPRSAPSAVVEARETHTPAEPSQAQKIEDALEALKKKLSGQDRTEGTSS